MKVFVSSHLHRYTGGRSELAATGTTLAEILDDLDRRYPGLRFRVVDEQDRIRPHMHFFVNEDLVRKIDHPVGERDEVHLLGALSGG